MTKNMASQGFTVAVDGKLVNFRKGQTLSKAQIKEFDLTRKGLVETGSDDAVGASSEPTET